MVEFLKNYAAMFAVTVFVAALITTVTPAALGICAVVAALAVANNA